MHHLSVEQVKANVQIEDIVRRRGVSLQKQTGGKTGDRRSPNRCDAGRSWPGSSPPTDNIISPVATTLFPGG